MNLSLGGMRAPVSKALNDMAAICAALLAYYSLFAFNLSIPLSLPEEN